MQMGKVAKKDLKRLAREVDTAVMVDEIQANYAKNTTLLQLDSKIHFHHRDPHRLDTMLLQQKSHHQAKGAPASIEFEQSMDDEDEDEEPQERAFSDARRQA